MALVRRDRENPALRAVVAVVRSGLVTVTGFSVLTNLLMLTSPIYMLLVYDKVLSSGQSATLLYLTMIAALALLVLGLLETVRLRLLGRIGAEVEHSLSPELLRTAVESTLNGTPTSAQPMRDLGSVRGFLGGSQVTALLDAPWVPFFVAALALLHPLLGLLGLGSAVILFALAILNDRLTRKPLAVSSGAALAGNQRLEFALRNAEAIKSMGMFDALRARWSGDNATAIIGQLAAADAGAAITGASRFLRLMAQTLVLALGAYLVLQNEMSAGAMIAASILLGRALAPVEQSMGSWRTFVGARDAWRRLTALLDRFPQESDRMDLPDPEGQVVFDDVWLVPQGLSEPTVAAVSLELSPGEVIGIIGPSGAGKSTLCKLLIGVWTPTRGSVRLDGAEIRHWNPAQLGRHLGYLPQDVELFDGTVRENIARMDGEADAEDIVWAAKTAGVHEFILSLPDAYDTQIGDGGSSLSGGQRQRLGLARAIYRRPKLLVLDEPHASLDGQGEADLMKAVEAAKGWGATVVLVAHRPAILRPADRLVVIHSGRIVMAGERTEILRRLQEPATVAQPAIPSRAGTFPVTAGPDETRPAEDVAQIHARTPGATRPGPGELSEEGRSENRGLSENEASDGVTWNGGTRDDATQSSAATSGAARNDDNVTAPAKFQTGATAVLERAEGAPKTRSRPLERLRARRKESSA
ncbi:type I secretion system permease/ATPase [Algihabitans sp.]|uniref:type I secretion system permease/ATPase n=1 Tax=Algihabitans sp. TaxID=2821514 RepID=UPI003BAD8CB6